MTNDKWPEETQQEDKAIAKSNRWVLDVLDVFVDIALLWWIFND